MDALDASFTKSINYNLIQTLESDQILRHNHGQIRPLARGVKLPNRRQPLSETRKLLPLIFGYGFNEDNNLNPRQIHQLEHLFEIRIGEKMQLHISAKHLIHKELLPSREILMAFLQVIQPLQTVLPVRYEKLVAFNK